MEMNKEEREQKRNMIRDSVMTSKEVVDYLGFSRTRLMHVVKSGRIVPIVSGLYLREDIEAFNKDRKQKK